MNTRPRRQPRLLILLALLMLAALPLGASANHPWSNYHWARTANPFTIKLGDNVSSAWDEHLAMTSADWSRSTVLDTTIVPGGTTPKRCRPTTGRVEVCNAAYGQNGWLGLAQIWISGSHITQGTAKMNDTYFNMAAYNNWSEKEHVMCQEVGHTFGLGHQSESGESLGTCMDYYYNRTDDRVSISPNQHDYEQLLAIYAHTDSSTTIGSTPAAVANAEVETPAQWGKLIHTSADGRASTYAREFAGGHRIITFVYWAHYPLIEHATGGGAAASPPLLCPVRRSARSTKNTRRHPSLHHAHAASDPRPRFPFSCCAAYNMPGSAYL